MAKSVAYVNQVARTALLSLLLVFSGCNQDSPVAVSSPPAPVTVTSPSSTPIAAEPNDASTRTACATRVWEELVRAFNAGDAMALERTIGSAPSTPFQWVAFFDGMGRDTEYTIDGARAMLLERWSRGQRLTLISVSAGAGPSWHGGVDASVRLESRAPSLTGTAPIFGKTVVSCLAARVMVVAIGDE